MIKAHFTFLSNDELLRKHGFGLGGAVQKAVDRAVIEFDKPYVPWKTGDLANSPETAAPIGGGKVIYNRPQARYLYYGKVMSPSIPIIKAGEVVGWFSPPGQKKRLTDRDLQYDTSVNALAGAFWFERMKADRKDDILKEARNAVT